VPKTLVISRFFRLLNSQLWCHEANPSIVFGAKIAIVSCSGQACEDERTNARLSELENTGKSLFSGVFSMSTQKDLGGIFFRQGQILMWLRMAQLA